MEHTQRIVHAGGVRVTRAQLATFEALATTAPLHKANGYPRIA